MTKSTVSSKTLEHFATAQIYSEYLTVVCTWWLQTHIARLPTPVAMTSLGCLVRQKSSNLSPLNSPLTEILNCHVDHCDAVSQASFPAQESRTPIPSRLYSSAPEIPRGIGCRILFFFLHFQSFGSATFLRIKGKNLPPRVKPVRS